MSISQSDNSYVSLPKQKWREFVYSLATPDNTSAITDPKGNYKYKWLELVGDNANTFTQLLSTNKIQENQLIGIDRREDNIQRCKQLFPSAQFYSEEWNSFCLRYPHQDIGIIILDSFNAAYGKEFKTILNNTMKLALRQKKAIGECLVVINVDGDKTHRGHAYKKGISRREVFKHSIEDIFKYSELHALRTIQVNTDTMYEYKQYENSANMLTCGILL
mgnify:FL=1